MALRSNRYYSFYKICQQELREDKGSLDNFKQREYLKQQHQLRNITKSSPALSADDMIENLLSRKEIFQKKKENSQNQKTSSTDPLWMIEGNEPAIYRKIWEQVCTSSGLTDTPKLSCILLGSGLGTDTLGYIWSLTNITISGALTKVELFRTLALVALAQKGYTFTNLLVLNQFSEAPIPRLDLRPSVAFMTNSSSSNQTSATTTTTTAQPTPAPQVPTVTETLNLLDTLTDPMVPPPVTTASSPVKSLSVLSATDLNKLTTAVDSNSVTSQVTIITDEDDFDDFKSADIFTTESLTVLDLKDSSSSMVMESTPNEDLFKTNITSFIFPAEKKNMSDDNVFTSSDLEEEKKPSFISDNIDSKKDSTVFSTSSLQEALREDLTLAPVSLSSIVPSMSSTAPVESDRYNALRQLAATNDNYPTQSVQGVLNDDFGEFITAAQPSTDSAATSPSGAAQSSFVQSDLQEKCLEACVHVLREANDLFKSIDDPKVLEEVVGDERGKRYLEEIVEVERIGHRIISSKTVQTDDCELSKQLESLCRALEPFTKPLELTHMEEEKGAKCGLCLCEIGPAHVKYGMNQFHAPCANLFLHVTGELLPLTPVT